MKKLNIRPDTGVYGTYKRISYEAWTALAEFVDNSTQSYYDHKIELQETKYWKYLSIEIEYIENSLSGDELVIKDNAFGMEYLDFQRAIILDRPPMKTSGRNEFGMGLKAAACWFGNLWSVETTALGSNMLYKAEIDIESLIKYKNEEIDVEEKEVNRKEHYTIIRIKKLNKKIKGKRIEKKIHELLSSIYRVDLRSGEVKIFYNGIELEFPEISPHIDKDGKIWKKDISFSLPYREDELLNVKGFIGIRIPGSPKNAGYTLIRRGRVIVGGPEKNYRPSEIFGLSNSYRYQRLYGELEMDNWPVTQAKDAFDWSNEDLEAQFIERLNELSEDFKNEAEEIRVREKVSISEVVSTLKESFQDNGSFKEVTVEVSNNLRTNKSLLPEENFVINEESDFVDESLQVKESSGLGVEIDDNSPIKVGFEHNKRVYTFFVINDCSNPKAQWLKMSVVNEVRNEYELTLNALHTFFYPFIQKKDFLVILIKFSIALVISEIEAYRIDGGSIKPSTIRVSMGKILEELSNE
ncbi:ATP-binding protein [Paracholeplasma manati]|uniref:ATP-binding protein n=1 Tax=Paracholeplasma manati TaxID=591373 RepID=UPI002407EA46|nr:ATP-binding protein [Paracholeplasma manati]MDG0889247.1 ATP-binding protein [Paracholeplasma manati]